MASHTATDSGVRPRLWQYLRSGARCFSTGTRCPPGERLDDTRRRRMPGRDRTAVAPSLTVARAENGQHIILTDGCRARQHRGADRRSKTLWNEVMRLSLECSSRRWRYSVLKLWSDSARLGVDAEAAEYLHFGRRFSADDSDSWGGFTGLGAPGRRRSSRDAARQPGGQRWPHRRRCRSPPGGWYRRTWPAAAGGSEAAAVTEAEAGWLAAAAAVAEPSAAAVAADISARRPADSLVRWMPAGDAVREGIARLDYNNSHDSVALELDDPERPAPARARPTRARRTTTDDLGIADNAGSSTQTASISMPRPPPLLRSRCSRIGRAAIRATMRCWSCAGGATGRTASSW